jgi:hypothetical protein
MKFQLVAYLLKGSEHVYWILDLEDEVHSIWDLWMSGFQECKADGLLKSGETYKCFRSGPKKLVGVGLPSAFPRYAILSSKVA